MEIPVFNGSLDEDQNYIEDEVEKEYINEICGKEQRDLVCIVLKELCLPKQEELT